MGPSSAPSTSGAPVSVASSPRNRTAGYAALAVSVQTEEREQPSGDRPSQRRFAASMVLHALKALQPLFNANRTDAQYFEAVESLVWLCDPGSNMYFETIGLDPVQARRKVDLPLYAELALTVFCDHLEFMRRMYVAMARYSLQEKNKRAGKAVPYAKIAEFADEALAYTTFILAQVQQSRPDKPVKSKGSLPSLLVTLSEISEQ